MAALKGFRIASQLTNAISRSLSSRVIQPASCSIFNAVTSSSGIPSGSSNFHTCSVLQGIEPNVPEKWPKYNDIVYPPRGPDEPRRPAEVFHMRNNIKYSQKKMWYIACMIRGMSVDEALKQLSFMKRAGSQVIKEVIEEAQELAVRDHNVEYRSNLWVADSFVGKAKVIKGMRKHAGMRFGVVRYGFIHYFVSLREGPPPKHYYTPKKTGNQMMEEYIQELRERRIKQSL